MPDMDALRASISHINNVADTCFDAKKFKPAQFLEKPKAKSVENLTENPVELKKSLPNNTDNMFVTFKNEPTKKSRFITRQPSINSDSSDVSRFV